MSDVGLDAQLALDIRPALEQVARLERALDAATHVRVTADTRDLTRAVTAGVDAGDSNVTLTGDGSQLAGEVTAGVDAGDSNVQITGDGSDLTGTVTSSVDAGDSNVALTADGSEITSTVTAATDAGDSHVELTADAGQLRTAADAADDLGFSLGTARLNAVELGTVLRGGAIVGAAVSLFQAAQAASELSEATSKATVVFGDGIGEVTAFAKAADTGLGLSESAALEATGTFGNLFNALGLSKDAATELAPAVVSLASDFASFNNLRLDETLEKLRSGLVGEIEPLRSLGVSFDAAAVEAKAMELGLAGANGEVTEGAKIQARWALILEQSKNAQGDFARTADGLANQQRILTAEFQNAVIAVGKQLEPALLDLIGTARQALPGFQELAVSGVGALINVVTALEPALGSATQILIALAPVVNAVAAGLDAIPDPVLQAVAAFLLIRRAAGPFSTLLDKIAFSAFDAAGGLNRLGGGLNLIQARAVASGIAVAGLSLAFAAWASEQAEAQASARAVESQVDKLSVAFQGTGQTVELYAEQLKSAVENSEELETATGKTGATITDLGALLDFAGLTVDQFAEAVAAGGSELERLLGPLEESGLRGNLTADALRDLGEQMQQSAERAIEAGTATELWNEEQADAAIAAATASDGTINYAGALDQLKESVVAATDVEAGHRATMEQTRATLESLAESAPAVAQALQAITQDGATGAEFVALSSAIGQATLSEEQLGQVAQALGVPLSALSTNVDLVTASMESFVSGVEGSLPSITEALSGLGEGVTFEGIRAEFAKTLQAMVDFEANLAALAAFPNVQAAAAAAGPQVAAVLAQGVRDGKTQSLQEMELMALGIAGTEQRIVDTSTNTYAPNFAAAQLQAGLGGTQAFVGSFQLAPHTTAQGTEAVNIMRSKGRELDSAATTAGRDTASGYGQGVAPLPGYASDAASKARQGILSADGYGAGYSVGSNVGSGFVAGVDGWTGEAQDKAAQLVLSAKAAADRAARSGSPSRLFMEVGRDIGQGLALGIEQQQATVVRAVQQTISAAANERNLLAAIDEVQRHLLAGGRIHEDFSFRGMSANLDRFNDDIAKLSKTVDAWRLDQRAAVILELERFEKDRRALIHAIATTPRLDSDVLSIAGGAVRAPTVVNNNVAPGAVILQIPAGLSPADQRRLLSEASTAFWGALQDRTITATARA
jgi:hypothetical protein